VVLDEMGVDVVEERVDGEVPAEGVVERGAEFLRSQHGHMVIESTNRQRAKGSRATGKPRHAESRLSNSHGKLLSL
jgi:hypothetical protein